MNGKERFIHALKRLPPLPGRVPHFELVFFLTMEAFRSVHPAHRDYNQWHQMTSTEKAAHIDDIADLYIKSAEEFGHDCIFIHDCAAYDGMVEAVASAIRDKTGDEYFLICHGDPTFAIPDGKGMEEFSIRIACEPEELHREAEGLVDKHLKKAERFMGRGLLDGFGMCSDYCFNNGPFLSPAMFHEFVAPYLSRTISAYREMGFYSIKHTDGNIMPIIDQLADTAPDALHSLDPQAGVDIAEIKRIYGGRFCLIGNVNCGLLQTGSDDDAVSSARYALQSGMPGGGYIFSTSNCVYTGMPLRRYKLMLDVLEKYGYYE